MFLFVVVLHIFVICFWITKIEYSYKLLLSRYVKYEYCFIVVLHVFGICFWITKNRITYSTSWFLIQIVNISMLVRSSNSTFVIGLGNYFVCKRFPVQTLLWSVEFVIQINLEHNTIAVWNLGLKLKYLSKNQLLLS